MAVLQCLAVPDTQALGAQPRRLGQGFVKVGFVLGVTAEPRQRRPLAEDALNRFTLDSIIHVSLQTTGGMDGAAPWGKRLTLQEGLLLDPNRGRRLRRALRLPSGTSGSGESNEYGAVPHHNCARVKPQLRSSGILRAFSPSLDGGVVTTST